MCGKFNYLPRTADCDICEGVLLDYLLENGWSLSPSMSDQGFLIKNDTKNRSHHFLSVKQRTSTNARTCMHVRNYDLLTDKCCSDFPFNTVVSLL